MTLISDEHAHKLLVSTLEQQLQEEKTKVIQQQTDQVEFLSRLSHELNTPLTTIIGFAEVLENSNLTVDQLDSLTRVLDAAKSLHQKSTHLLELAHAKNDQLVFSSVDLGETVRQCITTLQNEIDQKSLQIEIDEKLAGVILSLDKKHFNIVMYNLLLNAVQYSPEFGTITIKAHKVSKKVKILIYDQGLGIPPAYHSKVFRLFHDRNTENVEGVTRGLYLVKEYIELMGGNIGFDSKADDGTVFWVELPLNNEQ